MWRLIFLVVLFIPLVAFIAHKNKIGTVIFGVKVYFKPKTQKFLKPFSDAIKAFPELKGTSIEIRRKPIGTLMAARPKPCFIFRNRKDRRYVIVITDKPSMNSDKVYNSISEFALTGVLGHELSHILDYSGKTNIQMLLFAIKYSFNRRRIEYKTDKTAISRGFGEKIIEFNKFIYHSPYVNRKYLMAKQRFYLTVSDIEENLLLNYA
ncbi:MAG: hypothetical protein JXA77_09515 [Bacteroidales bacterium]|nr:hypothetical protein [Bacteroidales bacterium]MBN2817407.1 hypothetical protein [Bacteroidales bacterium]